MPYWWRLFVLPVLGVLRLGEPELLLHPQQLWAKSQGHMDKDTKDTFGVVALGILGGGCLLGILLLVSLVLNIYFELFFL